MRRSASSRPAATAARRRRTSPGRPVSPSRSSTAISPRSGSSTWRASRPRGSPSAPRSTTKLDELGDREAVDAIGQASREFHASGGIKPVTLWIQALNEAGGGRGDRRRSCAVSSERCTTTSPRRSGAAQAAGGVPADRDPDAEAWIFVGAALLLSFADRLGGLLGPDDFGRDGGRAPPLAHRRRLKNDRATAGRRATGRRSRPFRGLGRGSGSAPADPDPACAQV